CSVLGRSAGESAAKYASSTEYPPIDREQIATLKENFYADLGKTGINPEVVITEILRTIYPYDVCVLKSEASLKKALARIEMIRDELLPEMDSRDLHYLAKSKDVRSMALMAEMFLRASLMRKESRASHYRIDYPARDDRNWLKWIIINYEGGKLSLGTEPLPLDKYRIKSWGCYSDNFHFPRVGP
ncbi:MAG: FAD-binding protein, partial [Deltaproteobacteria bacterium]|nr:FAD-binding protein [Deltaproteobacteria bacterium]